MPLTSPGNDDGTGENHQPTLRKNTAEPAQQTLKQYRLAIQTTPHEAPVLGVGPDSAIGVSRPQMDLIEDFIHDPPAGPVVRFETAGDGHEGHWGF